MKQTTNVRKMAANQRSGYYCKDINELRDAFESIQSVIAGDTRFMAQALMFIAERSLTHGDQPLPMPIPLSELRGAFSRVRGTKKRPMTEWQKFFGEGVKAGKPARQIGKEWRERKLAAGSPET